MDANRSTFRSENRWWPREGDRINNGVVLCIRIAGGQKIYEAEREENVAREFYLSQREDAPQQPRRGNE